MSVNYFHIFASSYQGIRIQTHIVNKFSYLLLCGFLYYSTFTHITSALSTELTEGLDRTNNLNYSLPVSKPQRATATPCTTLTLRHPVAFTDDYSKRGLKVERRIEVRTQRNIQALRFEIESLLKSQFEESLKTKMLIFNWH